MLPLEVGQQALGDLALAAHRPEAYGDRAGGAAAAAGGEQSRRQRTNQELSAPKRAPAGHGDQEVWSQPPENPARCNPLRTYGLLRITRQIRPLR